MEIGQGQWAPGQRQEGTLENIIPEDANPDPEVAVGWGVPGRAGVSGAGVLLSL